jgi:endonuclease/exonuclease/phosphatase family metal-dependent hydrolase
MPLQRPAVVAPGAITLAVLTWNLHEGRGDLPRLVSDLAEGRITGSSPADYALLIQEAVPGRPSDPATIARARQLSIAFEPVRSTGAGTTGLAMLSTQPLTSTRVIALPRTRQPRMALAATILVSGIDLFLVNAHFENRVSLWRGLVFGDSARGRQAAALLAQLPEGPGIAGGDLNTSLGPGEPALRALRVRFPDTPDGTSEPTFRSRLVLDHLFFDVPDGWRIERRVLADSYGSDHHPVLGIIRAP